MLRAHHRDAGIVCTTCSISLTSVKAQETHANKFAHAANFQGRERLPVHQEEHRRQGRRLSFGSRKEQGYNAQGHCPRHQLRYRGRCQGWALCCPAPKPIQPGILFWTNRNASIIIITIKYCKPTRYKIISLTTTPIL